MRNPPMFLKLWQIKFPITAIVSVLHRITGVYMFMLLPCGLLMITHGLASPRGFIMLQHYFDALLPKFFLWAMCSAFVFHFLAGMRHMMLDFSLISSEKNAGCYSAFAVLFLAVLAAIGLGFRVW